MCVCACARACACVCVCVCVEKFPFAIYQQISILTTAA